jgi:predicted phosphoribosyltransferase
VPFVDRSDAGRQLAKALTAYKGQRPVVLALPRGGVPVAAEVAAMLDAPLDLILVRKIGTPYQPELAMGAVVDGGKPVTVRNEDVIRLSGVSEQEFNATRDEQLAEIERRRKLYLGDRPHSELAGRVVIVVDDGIATGATTRAALQATRIRKPRKLVLAVPVAPTDTLKKLRGDVDDLVCLEDYAQFGAIGYFYSDFRQVSDAEVIDILARHPLKPEASSKEEKARTRFD